MDEQSNRLVVNGNSGHPELEQAVLDVIDAAYQLWQSRNRKYGVTNIARTGVIGCYVRLEDKVARLHQYYVHAQNEAFSDEGIEDTWLDAINYAVMGLLAHRGQWPTEH